MTFSPSFSDPPISSADDIRSRPGDWPEGVQTIEIAGAADEEKQAAMFYEPGGPGAHPLLVFLHPWRGNYTFKTGIGMARECIRNGWAFLQPDFHGPNNRPQALGSDLVLADIENAVAYAKAHGTIDSRRVYLAGASGGGHATLLAMGRLPGLFAAASAWVPITDLPAWHNQCLKNGHSNYARDIETACGGVPSPGTSAEKEALRRSPLVHLSQAGNSWIDLNTGIHDGHGKNSVPISHSLKAFNLLASPDDRIAAEDIRNMEEAREISDNLRFSGTDEMYRPRKVLFRRTSRKARITVTDGDHEILVPAAFAWLKEADRNIVRQAPAAEPADITSR